MLKFGPKKVYLANTDPLLVNGNWLEICAIMDVTFLWLKGTIEWIIYSYMVDLKFTSVQTLKNVIVTLFDRKTSLVGQKTWFSNQKINKKVTFADSRTLKASPVIETDFATLFQWKPR